MESAVEQVVVAKYGVGFIAEWTPATLRGEYKAQAYGGVRTLAWDQARAWILGHLQRGKLNLLEVSKEDPPVIRACSSRFWRSSDHDDIERQKQILDRGEDPSGKWIYALDEAVLTALLEIGPTRDESKDTGRVAAGAPTTSPASRPATAAATRNPSRRGRKKGSGTKDDDSSLRAMLDLLADDKAPSVLAAAKIVAKGTEPLAGNSDESRIDRLRHKFSAKYGTEPPSGKTWEDVRKAGGV
jgi:hypothetical protein